MKRLVVYVACGLSFCAPVNRVEAQPKTNFFTGNTLPPPNGVYISPAQYHALYANGIVISNIIHRAFTESEPPPPAGTSSTHTFNSEVDFDLSVNNGTSFTRVTAPAQVTVNLQAVGTGGAVQIYDTEMLQLNITGGTLPSGLQVRVSTTQPSKGQTTVAPSSGGGFLISSFFDVFTEVSLDSGQTWTPSTTSGHMELRPDPTVIPPVQEPSPLLPPPSDQYISPALYHALYAQGIVIKDVKHKFFSQVVNPLNPPAGGGPVSEQFNSTVDCNVSYDSGVTFSPMSFPAMVSVTLTKVSQGPPMLFDTEMTQLDLNLGGSAAPILVRESPTRPSYGETSIEQESDGTFKISSFFDIFTELSLDGGQTWLPPTNGPAHVELQKPGTVFVRPVPNLPPTNGQYVFPGLVQYPGGIVLSNVINQNIGPSQAPPPPGQSAPRTFVSQFNMMLSTDGGRTFAPVSATGQGILLLTDYFPGPFTGGYADYYNVTLQQLSISGGNLPTGMMIRQGTNPSHPSIGRTAVSQIPGAVLNYRIDSFFDVFTELSVNGGQTWNPAVSDPAVVAYNPPIPPYVPYIINCPGDITVFATGPLGAVVTYLVLDNSPFYDCPLCCNSVTEMPPSGSLFPIGTTTVHVTGHNGCGEHPTCSFKVTVLPSIIYGGVSQYALGKAVLSTSLVDTNPYIIISNLFTDGSDGFTMNLGAASSAVVNFQPFPTTANCPTDLVTTATGTFGTDSNHSMGTGTYQGGSNAMIRADFSSLGANSVIAEVWDDDNHLVSSNYLANASWINVNTLFPPPCTNYNKTYYTYWQSPDHICYRFCIFGCNCLGTNCYTERIACIRPDIALASVGKALSGLQMQGAAAVPPGSFKVLNEQLGMFGLNHQGTGQAAFDARPGVLMVDNIGSSGQDGVLINLGSAGEFCMKLAPVALGNPIGVCWNEFISGQFNGNANAPLGRMTLSTPPAASGLLVQDDFTPMGATMTQVQIYQDCPTCPTPQLIASITEPSGVLGTMTSYGNLVESSALLRPLTGFKEHFDSNFTFMPATGTAQYMGNEIRILAANPNGTVQSLSRVQVGGCGIGQFTILGELAQPIVTGIVLGPGTGCLTCPPGAVEIDGKGAAGMTYQLLASPSLSTPMTWVPVSSTVSAPDGTFHLLDTRSNAPSQHFYEIKLPLGVAGIRGGAN